MKDKRTGRYLFWSRVLHPIALMIYGLICFYLYSLLQYGGVKRKVPIIIGGMVLLFIWILWCYYKRPQDQGSSKNIERTKVWLLIACILVILTTGITGIKIYESSIDFNGKLSWFLHDLKTKRQVEFIQNNIYQESLNGIFEDIQHRIKLPEELYLSHDFQLEFEEDGTILSFDTYLYGKNQEGDTESFLITYDSNQSEKIMVRLNGVVNDDYDDAKKLQLLLDMMQVIPLQELVAGRSHEKYGILYLGVRDWGYNTEGIVYIDDKGNTRQEAHAMDAIIGYTTSVYVPGREDRITPLRFIADWEGAKVPREADEGIEQKNDWALGYTYNDGEETFFLNQEIGYQLSIADAALGSRFYILLQTQDGGATWETLNEDPFLNSTGVSSGITFVNENLGFIGLSHSGGSYGELYRTEDGGQSYNQVSFPEVQVPLTENETYHPFDVLEMPYEEDGKLFVLLGQGQDGDYKGGCKALYESEDNGQAWEYIEEVMVE